METAIQKAARTRFGSDTEIRATIDRDTGEINLYKVLIVVDKPENLNIEISLQDAIEKEGKKDLTIGAEILEQLPPVDFGRIAAQTAKQVITQRVREAESTLDELSALRESSAKPPRLREDTGSLVSGTSLLPDQHSSGPSAGSHP